MFEPVVTRAGEDEVRTPELLQISQTLKLRRVEHLINDNDSDERRQQKWKQNKLINDESEIRREGNKVTIVIGNNGVSLVTMSQRHAWHDKDGDE